MPVPDGQPFKENTEYEIILAELRLDEKRKKWVAGYSFNIMVERLIDNHAQARRCTGKIEAKLVRTGRLEEFNQQFQDNVDRGVFRALTREETGRYRGPMKYTYQQVGSIQDRSSRYHPIEDLYEQKHEAAGAFRGQPE